MVQFYVNVRVSSLGRMQMVDGDVRGNLKPNKSSNSKEEPEYDRARGGDTETVRRIR